MEKARFGLRGGSRAAATSKMERFVIIVNGWKPLTIITKRSILDVAAVLDPPLSLLENTLAVSDYCMDSLPSKHEPFQTGNDRHEEPIELPNSFPVISYT